MEGGCARVGWRRGVSFFPGSSGYTCFFLYTLVVSFSMVRTRTRTRATRRGAASRRRGGREKKRWFWKWTQPNDPKVPEKRTEGTATQPHDPMVLANPTKGTAMQIERPQDGLSVIKWEVNTLLYNRENIEYNPCLSWHIRIPEKGSTLVFEIDFPDGYPSKEPTIKVISPFEYTCPPLYGDGWNNSITMMEMKDKILTLVDDSNSPLGKKFKKWDTRPTGFG